MSLHKWLMRSPRPDSCRVTLDSGEQHQMPRAAQTWVAWADSLTALEPIRVEAFADGKLLRAISGADAAEPDEPEPGAQESPSMVAARALATDDPETRRFLAVSAIVAEAYRHSTEVAFERMIGLFEAVNRRSEALEGSLDGAYKLLRRAWEDQLAAASEQQQQPDTLTQMATAFLGGSAQAAATAAPPPLANGKKGH